ncbi:hypothetical protein D3C71_1794690 [compost metagenome]
MGHTADVPDLGEDAGSDSVNRLCCQPPAGDLFGREDPRVEQIALSFTRDRRAFADDQACRGALGIIERDRLCGDVVGRARARHRRHHHAVGERETSKVEWGEDIGHGVLDARMSRTPCSGCGQKD